MRHDETSKNHACYILITCDHPNEEGKMEVSMSYEGDSALVSYLISGAQDIIEQRIDCECDEEHPPLKMIK